MNGHRHPALTRPPLFRRWLLWVGLGESVGFLAPTLAEFVTSDLPAANVPALVAAGAVEGAVLGWAQAHVLRDAIPALSRAAWVGGTAVAAAFAWFIGLLPSTWTAVWSAWPTGLVVGAAAVAGTLLLASIGFAQWLELRRHLARSGWWILGSAAAWCVGLGVFFAVATPLWQPGQPLPLIVAIGVLAGILMAASMAAVSGLVLVRLLGSQPADRTRTDPEQVESAR